jgi:hypothetical protein
MGTVASDLRAVPYAAFELVVAHLSMMSLGISDCSTEPHPAAISASSRENASSRSTQRQQHCAPFGFSPPQSQFPQLETSYPMIVTYQVIGNSEQEL